MRLRIVGALAALLCLAPLGARAEGSGGSGGASGTRDDWPCAGCVTVAPSGDGAPTPLLLTFHGDEGDPSYIHSAFEDRAPAAGFLLVSLKCPRALGCGGSWWRWEASGSHDDFAWVFEQLAAVEAAYDVERDQVYVAGFSGGSSYLSELVPRYTDRFAGALYLGGGYRPGGSCAECAIPIHFVIGSRDFLLDGAQNLSGWYEECGHPVDWQLVSGVDHQIVGDRLPDVLRSMAAATHPCRAPAPPPDAGAPDAGPPPGIDAGPRWDAGAPIPGTDGGAPAPPPMAEGRELRLVGDCSVGPSDGGDVVGAWLLLALVARSRRR